MKYVSIDIETTGLDIDKCEVVEVGAVIDDFSSQRPFDELPTWHCYVNKSVFRGEPEALAMHAEIFRRIGKHEEPYRYLWPEMVAGELGTWLHRNNAFDERGLVTIAGKNFASFDLQFLKRMDPEFWERVPHRTRFIDPAMLYWNPVEDDRLPNSKECMVRAKMDGEVAHTAVEDAMMVVKLLRIAVNKKIAFGI